MKIKILLLTTIPFLFMCYPSISVSAEYAVSTLYQGAIGGGNVSMYLTASGDSIAGKYVYDKFKKKHTH